MEQLEVILPMFWKGLEVKLSKVATTSDNEWLSNEDTVALVKLPAGHAADYVKNGDVLLLETENKEYSSHAYHYSENKNNNTHVFSPLSVFLEKETIVVADLSEIKILGKILCSFKNISEEICFKVFPEDA